MKRLSVAWLVLLALSSATTLLSLDVVPRTLSNALLLALALTKARIILSDYLGLRAAPFWRKGFSFALSLYVVGLLGLCLAA